VVSIYSAVEGDFRLAFDLETNKTNKLDPLYITADAMETALEGLDGFGSGPAEYEIEVTAKGNGKFEVEFLNTRFYLDIPDIKVVEQNTDGSVIAYTQGLREAFKTDFTVAKVEHTYLIGFQGKTRQLDAGPGVSYLSVDNGEMIGGEASVVTRMEGVNYYGIETLDVLLGSGSDIVSVQGTSQGSYDYDMGMTALIETSTDGDGGTVPEVQRLRLNAAGTFTLRLTGETATTDPITVDPADTSTLAQAIEDAINDSSTGLGVTVEVEQDNDKFTITFVNPANPNIADLVIDASNLSPVHAVTNISLGANNYDSSTGEYDDLEHVFVSSNAGLDRNTIFATDGNADPFDFLTGDLDDVRGDLNIDFGTGRHGLMVSDEAATEGDADVVITDIEPDLPDLNRLDPDSEIWITGLNFGGISYGVDPDGDLYEGIVYWTGSGADTISIDGTHVYKPAEFRTATVLNTGLGDDAITVDLYTGEDGFFVLHTMGGAAAHTPVADDIVESDNDTVRAAESTLPLIIFGGLGDDDIIAGQNEDVVFGDFGRVQYLDGEGELVAVFGFGSRDDMISSEIIDPTWVISRDLNLGGVDILEGQADDDILIGGAGGNSIGDYIDGDTGDDLIFGDAVRLERRDTTVDSLGDITNLRFQTLLGQVIYSRTDVPVTAQGISTLPGADQSGQALVDGMWRDSRNQDGSQVAAWNEYLIVELYHSQKIEAGLLDGLETSFGDDYIAGGANHDVIFGQLGDDIVQGDGSIEGAVGAETVTENRVTNPQPDLTPVYADRVQVGTLDLTPETTGVARNTLDYHASVEAGSDGDDYIEGNGGSDVIFGNLGQDDIVGDNSSLFTLDTRDERLPHGADIIFGGAGTDIGRNDIGDATIDGEGVITTDVDGHARDADVIAGDNANIYRLVGINGFDSGSFLTFNYDNYGGQTIIPRAVELLDYTPGGESFDPAAADDTGMGDEVHGESGDDFIYGMVGDDILFGDGQDDDMIGGYGNDWFSGGTGQDGVIGDDGRIFTSRNGLTEPLNGLLVATTQDFIATPGDIQQADIHVNGELKKAVDITPFSQDPAWIANDDEFAGDSTHTSDDIIYGGLGTDFLHGASGDDAISGAEALQAFFDAPVNPGDVLQYSLTTGEFSSYYEFEPLVAIDPFLLNFNEMEGVFREGGVIEKPTGQQEPNYGSVYDDGDDRIFGDLGNDWLVGGTGRDNIYGGWGDDLLNADDDHTTNAGLNDMPDTHPTYEDRAYGGAGRDRLIANTGGDRLIDWVGEFNSYIVPFAPFGMGTVSRTLQPQLAVFLYELSASDGADPSRDEDTGADPARNGEPEGELGAVRQKDFAWQDQTGAPDDPQAGNIPGGPRDVLRSASFNNPSKASGFFADSGVWEISGGKLHVSAESLGGDAVSVYHIEDPIPVYFEIQASVSMAKATGGWNANAHIIFDYQSPNDFKFAGIDDKTNKLVMGHRDATGWHYDEWAGIKGGVKPNRAYNLILAVNGVTVTLVYDNRQVFTHVYEPRVLDGYAYNLNYGLLGLGSDNARGTFDNIAVQILPPQITLDKTEDFAGQPMLSFDAVTGPWESNGVTYDVNPGTQTAMSLIDLGVDGLNVNSYLELSATVNTEGRAGIVFDRYEDSFKFVAIDAVTNEVVVGHYTTKKGWVSDAVVSRVIKAGKDYVLGVSLKGTTISVTLDGQAQTGYVFNATTVDGRFGLLAADGQASFDDVTLKTDDSQFDGYALRAAAAPGVVDHADILSSGELTSLVDAAIARLAQGFDLDVRTVAALSNSVNFEVADLSGLILGWADGDTVLIDDDAVGYGWFVDETPQDDVEFTRPARNGELISKSGSDAFGQMDLLTVIMHELGHVLGYEDLTSEADVGDLMYEVLTSGTRRTRTRLVATSETAYDTTAGWLGLDILKKGRSQFSDWHSDWLQRHQLLP